MGIVDLPRNQTTVFVASHSHHWASLLAGHAKRFGLSVVSVKPTWEAISEGVGTTESCVVLLEARQKDPDLTLIVRQLTEARPGAKAIVCGGNPDVALAARAIAAGAQHFLPGNTPGDELATAISDIHAGKQPSGDTFFGRVHASLPVPGAQEGWFRTPAGCRLSTHDAIRHCDQCGLHPEEIARQLKVPLADVHGLANGGRDGVSAAMRTSVIGPLVSAVGDGWRARRSLWVTLAVLLVIRCGVWVLWSRGAGVPTTRIRGRLVSSLSPADLRGLHLCFWPMEKNGGHAGSVRAGMVRIWSPDGSFAGDIISQPRGSRGSGNRYAVTILNGAFDVFPSEKVPSQYGRPGETPLRVDSLSGFIDLNIPRE